MGTEYDLSVLSGKHYSKSNSLVNSKGKANLLAQKLFAIGIQQAEEDEKTGILTATIRGTDLKKIFGTNRGSFYDEIKALTEPVKDRPSILDWRIFYANDDTQEIETINVITDCHFKNGILKIRYNDKINDQIRQLKQNYTVYSLAETIPLKSLYSFKLYEILKSEYDKQDYQAKKNNTWKENAVYSVDINITDLKLRFGLIDATKSAEITKELRKNAPDYQEIDNIIKEKVSNDLKKDLIKYNRWDNFKQFAIEVAKQELAEKTSIYFDYEALRTGRGGKTTGIRFFIHKKSDDIEVVELSDDEKMELLFEIKDILGKGFSVKDVTTIAETANYNIERITFAYGLMKSSKSTIENPTGWLIKAIQKDYSEPKSAAPTNFNFINRDVSYEDIEDALIENNAS